VKWKKELESIQETLSSFPTFAQWASKLKASLESIKKIVNKHIAAIK
jgi:hypothetical protein